MKTASTILVLSLLLVGCGRQHDAEFTKQIPGTWHNTLGTMFSNSVTIVPDGTFSYSRFATNSVHSWTEDGTWHIKDGVMVMVATNRVGKDAWPLGDFLDLRIIHLDDHLWTYEYGGMTNSMSR